MNEELVIEAFKKILQNRILLGITLGKYSFE